MVKEYLSDDLTQILFCMLT